MGSGGALAIDTTEASSGRQSLHATGQDANAVYLRQSFSKVTATITVEAKIFFQTNVTMPASAAAVQLVDIASGSSVLFYVDSGSARFQYSSVSGMADQYSDNFMPTPAAGTWHRVKITVSTVNRTVDASVDSQTWKSTLLDAAFGPAIELRVGLPSLYNHKGMADVWIDDVAVNVQ